MKLLILAQKIDERDPIFGFFHRWIIEIAKHCERVTVICLYEGTHALPAHVHVYSLGKESGSSRLKYLKNLYTYIWQFRHEYEAVFVHQNQEYAILGGLIWHLMGKRVYLWRNHYAGSWITNLAALACTKIFCTSKFSYTARFKQTVFMPVGVDTDIFRADSNGGSFLRASHSILSLGRIAPSKKLDQFIAAIGIVKTNNIAFTASIYGDYLPRDREYFDHLKESVEKFGLESYVSFKPGVPNEETPVIYASHEIFVNMSPSGMFDKTIFEAMACETIALNCNKNLTDKVDAAYIFAEDDEQELAAKLQKLLQMPPAELRSRGAELRHFAESNHSLKMLGNRLAEEMRTPTT
ncbi:MAG: glycosyltransferase [Patescibacteria group bacterium]|nr:glycosyltransferase [Patescibacteria group bacterium]MDE2172819.1 glycosyltransferase [Patescibacteria group bacterium]